MKIIAFFLLIITYSCSEKQFSDKKEINLLYEKAFDYQESGKTDSAFLYFYKAKDIFLQRRDSFGTAKCLVNLAIIQETKGDYFGSQETALSALHFLNPEDSLQYTYLSINYNTLGITSSKLEDYRKAIDFNQQALKFVPDMQNKIIYLNNLANNNRRIKNYNKSIKILDSLSKLITADNHSSHSRVLDNLAFTKWLQNSKYDPVPDFQKALNLRVKEKDHWGLNASYSHLADFYTEKKSDSALFFARKMYETAKKIKSPDDKIEALQKLISLENPENSRRYFKAYQKLNDSLQTARNKAKNQFALIRYETEKNKADFLKAKAESTERQNKIIVRNIIVIALIIFLIFGYLYYTRRQKRLQQEKLLEVKNTELKYAKKIHDRVANRIYQIMSQVENTQVIDKNALLFGLENVYETTRDISYENKDINENQNFSEQLHNMLDSYSSDYVTIIYNGNNENLWEGINFQIKTEAYLILQELMTNMKKHSKADKVFLKFERHETDVNISYTDNGIGIKNHIPKNGLQNMENRINAINGKINFDTETNNLLKINITFPI